MEMFIESDNIVPVLYSLVPLNNSERRTTYIMYGTLTDQHPTLSIYLSNHQSIYAYNYLSTHISIYRSIPSHSYGRIDTPSTSQVQI